MLRYLIIYSCAVPLRFQSSAPIQGRNALDGESWKRGTAAFKAYREKDQLCSRRSAVLSYFLGCNGFMMWLILFYLQPEENGSATGSCIMLCLCCLYGSTAGYFTGCLGKPAREICWIRPSVPFLPEIRATVWTLPCSQARKRKMGEHINNITSGLDTALQEKVKSERLKADLITNVSHDIKTPLTSIINYVDLFKAAENPGSQNRRLSGGAGSEVSEIKDADRRSGRSLKGQFRQSEAGGFGY